MDDIAPELLTQLQNQFKNNLASQPRLRALAKLINEGNATYKDAEDYAYYVGKALSEAFHTITPDILPDGRMYFNIADRVIRPLLTDDYDMVSNAALTVQRTLNKKAGLGIAAQKADIDEDRIANIIDKIVEAENFGDVAWVLDAPVQNFSLNVVDNVLKANVDFQGRAGLSPVIIRRSERRCCKWCSNLDGVYNYPEVPEDVYRRHERCRCVVEYDPKTGKRQNVHTKAWR